MTKYEGMVKKANFDGSEYFYITKLDGAKEGEVKIREGSIIEVLIAPYLGKNIKISSVEVQGKIQKLTLEQKQDGLTLTENIKKQYVGKLIAPYLDNYILVTVNQNGKIGELTISEYRTNGRYDKQCPKCNELELNEMGICNHCGYSETPE
jgi:hypothetical protein